MSNPRTILEYTIITKADFTVVSDNAYFNMEDSVQLQSNFGNSGTDITLSQARIDVLLKPTPYSTPLADRIVDIDLEQMEVDYLRLLHIRSDKYFLYAHADTLSNLGGTARELSSVIFKDFGPYVDPLGGFTPDLPYPKYIRLVNPLEINGGGTGNDVTDEPILVSVFMAFNRFNT